MNSVLKLTGLGVSAGIGIGKALILEKTDLNADSYIGPATENSLQEFENALLAVICKTQEYLDHAKSEQSEMKANILEAYVMLLEDPSLTDEVRRLIKEDRLNEVQAAKNGMDIMVHLFENMEDAYMRERAFDIMDIRDRIIMELLHVSKKDLSRLPSNSILVADDLTTSDTATLDVKNVAGILVRGGGKNSHASIMARNFEIPAIVAIDMAPGTIMDEEEIIMDGTEGVAYIRPAMDRVLEFQERKIAFLEEKSVLYQFKGKKSLTKDGLEREICANIGTPEEVARVLECTADGIGLFRSEFLFMDSASVPDEDKQFEAYRSVALGMEGKPVIIRTMDIGGDKELACMNLDKEENPFLGYRAIRICLVQTVIFKTQLTAILRASHFGKIKIMFPMISCLDELRQAKAVLAECMEELRAGHIPFDETIQVGIMIEIPAAVMMAGELARECDFFSIGTNDLIQYTMAVDRGNKKVSHLYSQYQPAVMRMIAKTIDAAREVGIPCGMCGEAAGDPFMIPVLLGMGLDEFSMSSSAVLRARSIFSKCDIRETKALAHKVLTLPTQDEVFGALKEFSETKLY